MNETDPLPVKITIGDEQLVRYISGFSVNRGPRNPVSIELDNGDELRLPSQFSESLLKAYADADE